MVAGQYFPPHSIIIQIDNANYYKNGRVYPLDFHRTRSINVYIVQLSVAMSQRQLIFYTYYLFQLY